MSRTQELAAMAAEIIEQRGWNGYGGGEPESCCALQALGIAAVGDSKHWTKDEFDPDFLVAATALADLVHPGWAQKELGVQEGVYFWNDEKGRTQDEVVAALRQVAMEPA